jgi:hypothetical protein
MLGRNVGVVGQAQTDATLRVAPMTFTINGNPVIAPDATTALRSAVARAAAKGSEFRDENGTLLAVYERIEIDGDWLLAWRRTDAWIAGGHGVTRR